MKKIFTFLVLLLFTQASVSVFASPPTVTGSNIKFSDLDGNKFSTNFTTGNGVYRIIVMKEGSPVTGLPLNGREYTSNSNFGTAGTEFTEPGEFVVASKTSWNSFTFQNLKPGTTYHLAVFEYNGTGTNAEYLMLPLTGSVSTITAPTTQATFTTSTAIGNAITLNFTKGNGSGRLILARKGAPVNASPVDLTYYYGEENFGSGTKINTDNYIVYRTNGTSGTVKNLEPNTTYHFSIFEYNGNTSPVFLNPAATTSFVTHTGPTVASSSIGLNYVEGNSFRLACTQGNGSRRLFIMSKNGPVTATPVNGINYTANKVFGTAGTEIAPGEFVVAAITGNSVDVTNLEGNTLYYFRIYDYDIDNAGNTYYLTSSSAIKTGSTALIPTTIGSNLRLTNLTGSSASIGLTHGNGTYRMVIVKEGSPVGAVPSDYLTYAGNANFGSGTQITPGNYVTHGLINGNPFTINNLKPGITYHVAIFEFNGNSAPVYSRTAATFSFSIPVEPTACATAPWTTFTEGSSFRLVWTNGNGAKRIIIARKGSAVTTMPVDGTIYTASQNVGEGSALSADEFVVYDGSYYSVDLKQMDISSTYHFAVVEYNLGADGKPDYLTSCWLPASASTATWPTTQTTIQSVTGIQANQVTINFTKGNGTSRLFIMREGAAVNVEPQDLIKYTYNTNFGTASTHISDGNYVVISSNGTGSSPVYNLKPLTTYYVSAFEFNGSTEPAYLRGVLSTFSFTTIDIPGATVPTTPSLNPIFTGVDGNKLTFKWTNGNGEKRIVVMKKDSPVSFVPASTTSYTANAAFGTGTNLGDNEYAVYNGIGSTVDITNLQPASTYHFAVFEYNGSGSLIRYLTSSTLTANSATAMSPSVNSHDINATTTVNSLALSWQNGNGSGRIVVMKEGSAITATPFNLSVYPANAVFTNGSQLAAGEYVVYAGTGNSVTITGLSQKTYHYSVFEYNGIAAPVYNTTALTGSASVGSTLPVNLEYFVAKEKDGKVVLDWATSQEINNDHFVVERSKDGSNFQSINIIRGAGNSNAKQEYSYTDDVIDNAEKVYYRLQQVDIDGKHTYSKIVVVNIWQSKNAINVYPNPVQDHFTIKLPAGITQATVILYNNNGAALITQKINTAKQFDVRHLPNGVYYISVQYADKKYRHTLIKH